MRSDFSKSRRSRIRDLPLRTCLTAAAALLCLFSWGPPPVYGAVDDEGAETYPIRKIFVEGNKRTDRDVVIRELIFEAGDSPTRADIRESAQRLLNMGIFDEVDWHLVPVSDTESEEAYYFLLELEERWTVIPLANGAFGGDLLSLQLGLYDINLFGRYLELGADYRRLGDTNSFSVWFRDPRFLGERLSLSTSIYRNARLRVLYDDAGQAEGGYFRSQWGMSLSFQKEWKWWLTSTFGLTAHADSFSDTYLGVELADMQRAAGGFPDDHEAFSLYAATQVGRIDRRSYLRDGLAGSLSVSYTPPILFSDLHYVDVVASGSAYTTGPLRSTLALTASTGYTTTESLEHQFYLGGLGSLRGFLDSRFRGKAYWLANAEFRIPSIDLDWLALQHVLFVDAGSAGRTPRGYADVDGLSVGIGFRLILPKVYNFVARVDWAFPLVGRGRSPLSLGSGQFL